jgi:rubredoxin
MDGKLQREYYVHCPVCSTAQLGLRSTYEKAAKELRELGWKQRGGLWLCPTCSGKEQRG